MAICRTPEEAFQAGFEDGQRDGPPSREVIEACVSILRPHIPRLVAHLAERESDDAA